jgi:hypothetical protein
VAILVNGPVRIPRISFKSINVYDRLFAAIFGAAKGIRGPAVFSIGLWRFPFHALAKCDLPSVDHCSEGGLSFSKKVTHAEAF